MSTSPFTLHAHGRRTERQSLSTGTSSSSSPAPPQANVLRRSLSTSLANQMSLRGVRRLEIRRTLEENHYLAQKARSRVMDPPVDYRLLDYVTEPDANLVCAICKCPFVDPVVLPDCDHCFCRDCIRQSWTIPHPLGPRGDCPTCRTPGKLGPRSATSKILVNILDDLEVQCPKHSEGCTAKMKRGHVQDHVTLYCGYGTLECLAQDCDLPVLRKDSSGGCLHYGVSCIDCHQSMLKSHLEQHWKLQCPDRKVHCGRCRSDINYRDLEEHNGFTCPFISIPCPGHEYGCTARFKREIEAHARDCPLAKLAPIFNAQRQRLDEHEAAQLQMSRKLEVFEQGLTSIQQLLDDRANDPDNASADESRIPLLPGQYRRADSFTTARSNVPFDDSSLPPQQERVGFLDPDNAIRWFQPADRPISRPGHGMDTVIDPFPDFENQDLPPPAENGPYTSPIHHLLSMHENLRNEVTRISAAVQELDGRHSMQTLNENLRTREELAYLTGQVAGMSRQVHWLTSAQLQSQQSRSGGGNGRTGDFSEIASAGVGVEAAVNAVGSAASALRGAARMVSGAGSSSSGAGVREGLTRRGTSDEGRTKL